MKKRTYTIQIENPCNEDWDAMKTSGNGRFCDTCSHHVIDFSNMSDSELIRLIEKKKGKLCGQFDEAQLNRMLVQQGTQQRNGLFRWIAGLFILGSSGTAFTQNPVSRMEIRANSAEILQALPEENPEISPKSKTFEGQLLDAASGQVLSGGTITLKGSKLSCTSDYEGKFSMTVPDSLLSKELTFTVQKNDYTEQSVMIRDFALPAARIFHLKAKYPPKTEPEPRMMMKGDIMIR